MTYIARLERLNQPIIRNSETIFTDDIVIEWAEWTPTGGAAPAGEPLLRFSIATNSTKSYRAVLWAHGWTVTVSRGGDWVVAPIDQSEPVEAGAHALWTEHPYLQEDFTYAWCRKVARTVIEATELAQQ